MSVPKLLVAWDSCVTLDALLGNEHWPDLKPVYDDASRGKIEILISEVTVAEACRLRKNNATPITDEAETIKRFFDKSFFKRIPVTSAESELAADFIREHNLEACDAIIAATACEHDAVVLFTRDGDKKRRASQPSLLKCDGLLGKPPLQIKVPDAAAYTGATLFARPSP